MGPLLGKFIQQFNDNCPNDKLRITAHSLGSRVTLSAIQSLYDGNSDILKKSYLFIYWVLPLIKNKLL